MLSDSLTLDVEGRRQQALAESDRQQAPGLCGSAWLGSVGVRAVGARGLFLGVRYVAGLGECVSQHAVHLDLGLGIGEGMRRIPTPDEVSWIRRWRAFLLGMIDPVLDCQGIMLDDDGHPMFRFGRPDPSDPSTILRDGVRWRVGDHFYTKGHSLYHQSDLHTPVEDLRSVQPLTAEEQAGSYECRIGPRRQPSVCAQVVEHIARSGANRSAALPAVSALLEQSLKNTLAGAEVMKDKTEAASRVRDVIEKWGCEKALTPEQMAVLLASAEPVLSAHGLKAQWEPAHPTCRDGVLDRLDRMDFDRAVLLRGLMDEHGVGLEVAQLLHDQIYCPKKKPTVQGGPPWLGLLGALGRKPRLSVHPRNDNGHASGHGSDEAVHTQPAARVESLGESSLPKLSISDKQFGAKWRKHATDWGLNPSNAEEREWFKNRIRKIVEHKEEVRQGAWHPEAGGGADYLFFRQGSDVVVTTSEGSFVTIMREADNNGWFRKANKKQSGSAEVEGNE